jgi:hypothetical protein
MVKKPDDMTRKILAYIILCRGLGTITETELNTAIDKEDFFNMSWDEIRKRYGKMIDEKCDRLIKEVDAEEKAKKGGKKK